MTTLLTRKAEYKTKCRRPATIDCVLYLNYLDFDVITSNSSVTSYGLLHSLTSSRALGHVSDSHVTAFQPIGTQNKQEVCDNVAYITVILGV